MKDLIKPLLAVLAIGLWCAGMVWNMIKERKLRQEREDLTRRLPDLSDKRYVLPEQFDPHCWVGEYGHVYDTHCAFPDKEINVIQKPVEPEPVPRCECVNTTRHVEEV